MACGARTSLPDFSAARDAGAPPADAGRDADATPFRDAEVTHPDGGCTGDPSCDDRVACTLDACDRASGDCLHAPEDAVCQNGLYCDGDKRCDPMGGCVVTPRSCDDGISCTHDGCDEPSKSCQHVPDDSLCPVGFACDTAAGCVARGFAVSDSIFYDVRLPSGAVTTVGPTGTTLDDVALHPNGTVYGVSFGGLFTVDPQSGSSNFLAPEGDSLNALDAAPDGTLYAAGGSMLFTLDPTSGTLTPVLAYPNGYSSSGDIAFVGGRLLATVTGGGGNDLLLGVDLASGSSMVVGDIGYSCVWGLAAYGATLFGFTCNGEVLGIDPGTGAGTLLTTQAGVSFYGASSR